MKQYGFKSTIFLISLILTATILLKVSIASEDKTFNEYYSNTNKFSAQLLQINEPADLRSDLLVKSKQCDGNLCQYLILEHLEEGKTRILGQFEANQVKPLRTFTNGYRDFSIIRNEISQTATFSDGAYKLPETKGNENDLGKTPLYDDMRQYVLEYIPELKELNTSFYDEEKLSENDRMYMQLVFCIDGVVSILHFDGHKAETALRYGISFCEDEFDRYTKHISEQLINNENFFDIEDVDAKMNAEVGLTEKLFATIVPVYEEKPE